MKHIAAILALSLTACSTAGLQHRDPEYQKRPSLKTSLLRDGGSLGDEAIAKLLSSRVELPARAKLAVFPYAHFGGQLMDGWRLSEAVPVEFLQSRRSFLDAVEQPLLATNRFVEITHVPDLLMPAELTLSKLRDTAALMQADLLLIYATRAQLLTHHGSLFSKDAVKAFVSVDVVVMDIRTGVVPFAETLEDIHEIKAAEDWSIADLQRRAEQEGLGKVLTTAGTRLVRFFTAK